MFYQISDVITIRMKIEIVNYFIYASTVISEMKKSLRAFETDGFPKTLQ